MNPPQVLFADEVRLRLLGDTSPAARPRWTPWERLRALPVRVVLRWLLVVAAALLCPGELTAALALLMLCVGRLVDEGAKPAVGATESRIGAQHGVEVLVAGSGAALARGVPTRRA